MAKIDRQILCIHHAGNPAAGAIIRYLLRACGLRRNSRVTNGRLSWSQSERGAFLSETFRGAIQAVPKGQTEAAYATGMTPAQAMRRIIFPQAVRIAIPPMGNTFIGMLKETSLVAAIGVTELLRSAQLLVSQYALNMPFYLAIGVIYWIMSIGFSAILEQVERRLARAY